MSHTKERPILMSGPMVRALLEGRKTQTRRVVKHKLTQLGDGHFYAFDHRGANYRVNTRTTTARAWANLLQFCPHGQPGQKLWVRETFSGPHCMEATEGRAAVPPSKWDRSPHIWYWADGNPESGDWTKPRASIFMPRWASRILLEITDVRVERLQDISEEDAKAEGARSADPVTGRECILEPNKGSYRLHYRDIWESINGAGSWDANPFVWVIQFRRVNAG